RVKLASRNSSPVPDWISLVTASNLGDIPRVTTPIVSAPTTIPETIYDYDVLNRVKKITDAEEGVTEFS
ncbi:hypothetical protein, partial [Cellvibrio mixtus]|uniref:hypothetical protein n=1 Tax=Cellvibrio mixtus TaxID=39650 RepID=UPI000586B15D